MEGKVLRLVAGLGVFKHNAIRIEGVAGNHRQAIIAVHADQFPILRGRLFNGHLSFTGDDLHLQFLLKVSIDGFFRDLFCKSGHSGF